MTERTLVARIGDHLYGFLRDLQDQGMRVPVPKQRLFLQSIEAVGPRDTAHLYWLGAATLTTSHEDLATYTPVFDHWFGESAARHPHDRRFPDDEAPAARGNGDDAPFTAVSGDEAGLSASHSEREGHPVVGPAGDDDLAVLALLRRELPGAVPTVRSRRRRPARRGPWLDVARVIRESRRSHGEIMTLRWRDRPQRQRRMLLLIDVSGSMKQHTSDFLRFAHAALGCLDRVEVFTFGTRLTRVTRTLHARDVDAAVAALSDIVVDADGGTQIGAALQEFLGNARYVTMARDALVIVFSDGLERGDCRPMQAAVQRLSLLSHRLLWWSPLACDPAYRPSTRGMSAIRDRLDALAGARDLRTAYEQVPTLTRK